MKNFIQYKYIFGIIDKASGSLFTKNKNKESNTYQMIGNVFSRF